MSYKNKDRAIQESTGYDITIYFQQNYIYMGGMLESCMLSCMLSCCVLNVGDVNA